VAENNDDQDFVGQVRIEGTEQATKELTSMGDAGAEAFDKIGKSSEDAAAKVKKSSETQTKANEKVTESAEDVADAVKEIGKALQPRQIPAEALQEVESSISTFLTSVRKGVKDVVEFGTRVAALGAAGAAAGIGLLVYARNVSEQLNSTSDAVDKQLAVQTALTNQQGQATQGAIQYNSQIRQLNASLANGTIDQASYNKQLDATKAQYKEQVRVQNEVAAAQEETRIQLERLQKQAADTKAFNALVNMLGGPLVTSLVQLGNQVEAVRRDLVTSFSPAGASIVDALGSAFDKSSAMLSAFVAQASTQIQSLVAQNGPAIDQAVSGTIGVVQQLLSSLIAAGPVILKLVNGVIIPAFNGVILILDQVAALINSVFGTQINAAFLIGLAGVLKFTKAFQALFAVFAVVGNGVRVFQALNVALMAVVGNAGGLIAVIRVLLSLFTPWGLAITALTIAFTLLYRSINWQQFAANAQAAGAVVVAAWSAVANFFTTTIPTAFGAARDYIVAAFNGVVEFFATLPQRVADIFALVANAITSAIQGAVTTALNYIKSWADSAYKYKQPINYLMNKSASAEVGVGGGGGGPPGFAGGGHAGSGVVRGPGTSTSDSILALLSNNEFVMRARAVRKYGLSFMRAVNSGVLDLSSLRGFAMGGHVSIPSLSIPAFAGGGSPEGGSSSLRPMTFVIGGEIFEGMMAPAHVASKLERYATSKNTQSAGRRPSWVN
jgi:hypothetical protein